MTTSTALATAADVSKMVSDAANTHGAQAQKMMEDGAVKARAAMETGMAKAQETAAKMAKAAEEAAEFGRGNVEAITQAVQVYFAGMQDLGKQFAATMQNFSTHTMEGAKAITSAKSVKEMTDLQAGLARTAFEKSVADGNKLRESLTKLTEAAFAPLTARMNLATEKFAKPLAA